MLVTGLLVFHAGLAASVARADDATEPAAPTDLSITIDGEVDASFEAVRSVLLDVAGLGAWFPGVDDWIVIGRTPDSVLIYGSQDLPWPVQDRDYVVRYRWWSPRRNEFVLEARTVLADEVPRRARRVRVERMRTHWTVAAADERTQVRYTYESGTGMPLPRWVARIGWERHAGAVVEGLAEEVARRDLAGSPKPDE